MTLEYQLKLPLFERIKRSWRCRTAEGRLAQRESDARIVWPLLWDLSDQRVGQFLISANLFMAESPAWTYDNWTDEPSNPGCWAAVKWNEMSLAEKVKEVKNGYQNKQN